MSNQVTPWFGWRRPGRRRADDDVVAVDRVDGEVGAARERPLRVGGRQAVAGLEQAEGPADVAVERVAQAGTAQAGGDVLEEVDGVAAAAGPEVLVGRARALLVGGHAGGVAAGAAPGDVAVADEVGVGDRAAVVLGAAVEQGAGDLGGGAAGLGRPVVELGDLEVAVAVDARQLSRGPDLGLERPVVVQDAPDALVVAEDQPRQAGGRVDHRGDAVVVGPAHVERDPRDAGAVVGEAGVVVGIAGARWPRTGVSGRG